VIQVGLGEDVAHAEGTGHLVGRRRGFEWDSVIFGGLCCDSGGLYCGISSAEGCIVTVMWRVIEV
jgi:hypothetical protein